MKIYYTSRFGKSYKKLTAKIKSQAKKKEKIFRKNPFDSRLKTHKLHGECKDYWSFSISDSYRIMFDFSSEDIVIFINIGDHDIYN